MSYLVRITTDSDTHPANHSLPESSQLWSNSLLPTPAVRQDGEGLHSSHLNPLTVPHSLRQEVLRRCHSRLFTPSIDLKLEDLAWLLLCFMDVLTPSAV